MDAEETTESVAGEDTATAAPERTWTIRRIAGWFVTALACLFVFFALVAPVTLTQFSPWVFLRIPVEALAGAALMLVLPQRARRIVAAVLGVLLGLLFLLKLLDIGFYFTLSSPFDPLFGWSFLVPGVNYLFGLLGNVGAIAAIIGVVAVALGVVVLMTLAVMRLSKLAAGHSLRTGGVTAVLGVVWLVCALVGTQLTPGQPFASRTVAVLAYDNVLQVGEDVQNTRQFDQQTQHDPFGNTPASQLLTKLRGKNVLLVFVESYGRASLEGQSYSPAIDAQLLAGTKELTAAGFGSASAFVTSPSVGGGSWLGHSTIQSGLWIDNEYRYQQLVKLNRLTLSSAFQKAGWRTIGDSPSNVTTLPKATVYAYDKFYDDLNVGYRGPKFSYATMPDQYVMSALQRNELSTPGHQPVMAEIDLVSSHDPWAPLPRQVDWNKVGDGSIFDPMPAQGQQPGDILSSPDKLRAAYAQSIQYTLGVLISYLKTYGDKNTVMLFMGDEQPAALITNDSQNRDVPVTMVADPSVIQQISSWHWQPGLLPQPDSPVWPMSAFRDKFLSAYDGP